MTLPITAQQLRDLSEDDFNTLISSLNATQADELIHMWDFWARPDQLEPKGDWKIWMPLAGRGWGKTRTGAEWVRHRVKMGDKRIACIAPTKGDVRRVMIEGESGLINVCWEHDKTYNGTHLGKPLWTPTNNTLTWANGAKAEMFSAEDPERLRGPQFHSAWADEMAAWRNMEETWDMLQFTLRLGKLPRVLVTTTPKPKKLIRRLIDLGTKEPERYIITSGSSYDNKDNIDLEALRQYEGTRLGRQELYAEVLTEAAGALWSMEMLDKAQIHSDEVPWDDLVQIVVSVDPATTANEESDMTGIVVAALDIRGTGYVLEDATLQGTPKQWASKALELYEKYKANFIVFERNQGGDMVRYTLEIAAEEKYGSSDAVALRGVSASRGKFARAEPVSALYEQGRVKHVPDLDQLENQMVTWEPLEKVGSPDRLDAMVWAITKLMLGSVARPPLSLGYANAESLKESLYG